MNTTARPADRKISSSGSQFKKVLQAFANGDLPYSDVQGHLQRLLGSGASPDEMRDILQRYQSIEPLPEYAHEEILRNLQEAIARTPPAPDPERSQTAEAGSGPPSSSATADARPNERPEPIAAATEARSMPSAAISTLSSARPAMRAGGAGGDAMSPIAENVSSIEDRIARQKADYKALNHAYERVRDAGSAASARTIALAAELAAARSALELEQEKARAAERALAETTAAAAAERARTAEARRELEGAQNELRRLRDSLSEGDASRALPLEVTQTKIREADEAWSEKLTSAEAARQGAEAGRREAEAAQKQAEAALRQAQAAQKQAEAALAQSAAELESTRAALELEHGKSKETRRALAERVTAAEAAQSQGEEALRKLEGYRNELSKTRELLASQKQEHARSIATLESRNKLLEARLQTAERRAESRREDAKASDEITVVLEPPRDRAVPRPPDPPIDPPTRTPIATAAAAAQAAAASSPPAAVAAREPPPVEARETPPGAAFKPSPSSSKRAAQFYDYPLFGSRGRGGAGAIVRFGWVSAAIALLALVAWAFVHRAPPTKIPAITEAAAPKAGSVIRDCPTCPAMTIVPAGRFKQGSNRADGNSASFEKPPHWVLIGHPFAVATNAVTVDEFRPFVEATGRDMRGCDTFEDKWRFRPEAGWENPGFVQTGSHPVTCVSWDDAKAYAGWLSKATGHHYRLPSAAEWEYAARAGAEAVRPWNSDGSGACANANVADQRAARRYPGWSVFPCDDGYVYTAPVGSFAANAFGLNDMLGNVFQWTDDCWHADYTGVPTDGSSRTYGDCSERELRGGSWFTTPEFVRASYRNHFGVNYRASSVGIRLVRDLAP